MDLPTCPACGQSVLDDETDECPFCGASMRGKPAATATKPVPAATTAPRTQSASTAAPAPAATIRKPATASAPSEPKIASDDPFELERSADAKKKVVQLRLKPETGRRHEVKCPMCETVGYTGRKAAGMDVKCANPACKFPYFAAPPLDDDDEEPTEKSHAETDAEPAKKSLVTRERIIAYSVIGVVSIVALWFFAFRKPSRPKPSNGGPNPKTNSVANGEPEIKTIIPDKNGKKPVPPEPRDELLAIRRDALALMVTHSGQTQPLRLLEKSIAWQWTVDAHVRAGELDAAKAHMERLRVVTDSGPFYRALPLVATAWQHLDRGTPEAGSAAKQALDDALAAAKRLPPHDRQRYDITAELSAALFAAGRTKEAETLLAANSDADDASRASLFAHRVRLLERFDAEAALRNRPLDVPPLFPSSIRPPRVVGTLVLAGHGRWKQAWDWATSQPEGSVRDDCIIAWAEMRSIHVRSDRLQPVKKDKPAAKNPNAVPTLDEAAAQLSGPVARGTLYARIAFRLHERKKIDESRTVLSKARDALRDVKAEAEPKTPAVKDVSTFPIVSDAERQNRRTAAFALAELARAELRLDPKAAAPAWKALSRGLDVARSIAPPPADVAQMVGSVTVRNAAAVRGELQRITGAEGDALDLEFKKYVGKLKQINEAAIARFEIEIRLLVAAAHWGAYSKSKSPAFLQLIWKDVETRNGKPNAVGREDWFTTRVPWLLAGSADIAAAPQLAADIRKKIAGSKHLSRRQFAWDPFQAAMRQEQFNAAAKALSDRRLNANWVTGVVWSEVSRFADAGGLDAGKRFIREFQDPLLKMDTLALLAARGASLGKAKEVWAAIQDDALESPQKVAMCYGLLIAMQIPSEKPAAKKTKQP